MNKKKQLRLTKQTIRQLMDVAMPHVRGGQDDDGHLGTNHCASGKASGCVKGCQL